MALSAPLLLRLERAAAAAATVPTQATVALVKADGLDGEAVVRAVRTELARA